MKRGESGQPVPGLARKLELMFRRGGYSFASERRVPVCDRESLAEALKTDPSQIARWCKENRIPKIRNAQALARIFSIEPRWLEQPCDVFEKLWYGTHAPSSWLRLLETVSQEAAGTLTQIDPEPLRALVARPESTVRQLPILDRGALFSAEFHLPASGSGQAAWMNWHVALFSEDPTGFVCLLPRYLGCAEFPRAQYGRFGGANRFECGRLRLDADRIGEHSLVLVAHRDPLPEDILAVLTSREGEALLPGLEKFAEFLLESRAPAILRMRFRVRSA